MGLTVFSDEYFMNEALKEAQKAFDADEVPVGAIITYNHRIIARAHNQVEQLSDVTAHAEMIALTSASNYLGSKYLPECSLYVTLEPCLMCAQAMGWAQLGKLIYGASDPQRGYLRADIPVLHPKTTVKSEVLALPCSEVLKTFFMEKRE